MNIREKLNARRFVYPSEAWEQSRKKQWRIMWGCLIAVVLSGLISLAVNIWVLFQIRG